MAGTQTPSAGTARPWAIGQDGEGEAALHERYTRVAISAAAEINGFVYRQHIAELLLWDDQAKADARLIVAAVNNFNELRDLLSAFVDAAWGPPELLKRAATLLAMIDAEEQP